MPFDRRLATLTVELSAAAHRDRLGAEAATEALGLTGF